MIWDLHVHLGARPHAGYTADALLADMDEALVDRACVFSFVETLDNRYPRTAAASHPDRLTPFHMVDPWQTDAADDLRRALADGARGVKLHPSRQSVAVNREEIVGPLLRACQAHRAVFFAHGASEAFNTPAKFGQIAAAYPEVPIVMGHSGAPWGLSEAIDATRRHPNLHLTTSLVSVNGIRRIVGEAGPEKLLLASDAPFNGVREEIAKVRAALDDRRDLDLVLGENLHRILDRDLARDSPVEDRAA